MSKSAPTSSEINREQRDVELFDGIADYYCRKDLSPASRHARRQRLLQTLRFADLSQERDILELGCGAGWSVRYLSGEFRRYVGVDYSESLLDLARHHHGGESVLFETCNVKELTFECEFDIVFMIGVLHHIDDIPAAMNRAIAALKPGGCLVVNEPQPGNPLVQLARKVRKWTDPSYSDDQVTLSRRRLYELFQNEGLAEVKVVPQGYVSTPFAETVMPCQFLSAPLSRAACFLDRMLERVPLPFPPVSWNLVACGFKPAG